MSNETFNRQRTRQDLQDLARQAKAKPASSFDTADSSGYVDLSAFSATDSSWVDRELARARTGLPAPPGKSAAINALSPESMAPVSLAALLDAPQEEEIAPRRGRRALYVMAGLASVAAVAALAVLVARHAPPPEMKTAAAAVAIPPVAADVPAPTAAAAPPAATTPDPATPAPTVTPSTAAPGAATTKTPVTAQARSKHVAPAARAPVAAASHPAAARPVVIPASKTPSSGDSLMDMMRASVKTK